MRRISSALLAFATLMCAAGCLGNSPGALSNPIPYMQESEVGDHWTVALNTVNLDAAEHIGLRDLNNSGPEEGHVFVSVDLIVDYRGFPLIGRLADAMTTAIVSRDGTEFTDACDTYAGSAYSSRQIERGGGARGDVCHSVPADQLEGASLRVTFTSPLPRSRAHFALPTEGLSEGQR